MSDKDQHNITKKAGHQPKSFDWHARRAIPYPLGVIMIRCFPKFMTDLIRLFSSHEKTL